MNIANNDEQRLFLDELRKFLQAENDFETRRKRLSAASPERLALWAGLVEIGAIGAAFYEQYGGFAGDARTIAIAMSEFGRALAVEPYLGCAVVAGHVLSALDDPRQAHDAVASTLNGSVITILAHDAGVDPFAPPPLLRTTCWRRLFDQRRRSMCTTRRRGRPIYLNDNV